MNGEPIVVLPEERKLAGTYNGIAVYTAAEGDAGVIMLPVAPGCKLQPYYPL